MDKRLKKSFNIDSSEQKQGTLDVVSNVGADEQKSLSEGERVTLIGNVIIGLSVACAIIGMLVYGRVEIATSYTIQTQWVFAVIVYCLWGGLNGAFFGYLLSKVGRVLQHLESSKM
jgi:hypothetical protein